jgi:hypothetical protein
VEARPDGLDQTVIPLDDVPLRMGIKPGQETVLAVEMTRAGFDWSLARACLAHYERGLQADRLSWERSLNQAPARVEWDPERDLHLRAIATAGAIRRAARCYADEWTVSITDITALAAEIHRLVRDGQEQAARQIVPAERPYPTRGSAGLGLQPARQFATVTRQHGNNVSPRQHEVSALTGFHADHPTTLTRPERPIGCNA